jgi:transposase InsO family protein
MRWRVELNLSLKQPVIKSTYLNPQVFVVDPGILGTKVDLSEYENYTYAVRQLGRFLDEMYMHKRTRSSLGYLIPAEFEQQWLAQ